MAEAISGIAGVNGKYHNRATGATSSIESSIADIAS